MVSTLDSGASAPGSSTGLGHCVVFLGKTLKDIRAHCYCASLVRTLFIGHARATSFSSARTESKT